MLQRIKQFKYNCSVNVANINVAITDRDQRCTINKGAYSFQSILRAEQFPLELLISLKLTMFKCEINQRAWEWMGSTDRGEGQAQPYKVVEGSIQ